MIHYALRCGAGHEFDGWFKSSASFDDQASAGLLECPACASTAVQRALMAPSISPRAAAPQPLTPPPASLKPGSPHSGTPHAGAAAASQAPGSSVPAPAPSEAHTLLPDMMRAALQRMRSEIEKKCDYVGPHFAAEVRRMADSATPSRPIYGEATPDEAAALADDGIDVARIPWVPRAES